MKKYLLPFLILSGVISGFGSVYATASHSCPFPCEKREHNVCCIGADKTTDGSVSVWSKSGVMRVDTPSSTLAN